MANIKPLILEETKINEPLYTLASRHYPHKIRDGIVNNKSARLHAAYYRETDNCIVPVYITNEGEVFIPSSLRMKAYSKRARSRKMNKSKHNKQNPIKNSANNTNKVVIQINGKEFVCEGEAVVSIKVTS